MNLHDNSDTGKQSETGSSSGRNSGPPHPAEIARDRLPIRGVSRSQIESIAAKAPSREAWRQRRRAGNRPVSPDLDARIEAYLSQIPGANSGEHGHDRTFYVANRLVRGFDQTPAAALPHLAKWNLKCNPPWSERELLRKLEQADLQSGPRGFLIADTHPIGKGETATNKPLRNYRWDEVPDGETMRKVKVGRSAREITEEITCRTFGWPKRCGPRLFVIDQHDRPDFLRQTPDLFAWLNLTLSSSTTSSPIDWAGGSDMLGKDELRAGLHHVVDQFDQLELFPHEPQLPRTYYHHPEPQGGDGATLQGLLRMLSPSTPHDEELLRAMLLTLVWGGPPGARPAFLITAEETARDGGRGAGKTKTCEKLASLLGGVAKVSPDQDFARWCDSYISGRFASGAAGNRVLLLDNLKALRFSSADIEALITGQTISGHLMYHGLVQVPNTLTLMMTGNAPAMGKDMAQRVITIELTPAEFSPTWETEIESYIERFRWAIIGDLLATLRKPAGEMSDPLRWGTWCGEVLSRCTEPNELVRVIRARQRSLDADDDNAEQLRAGIVAAVLSEMQVRSIAANTEDESDWRGSPESKTVLITSARLAKIYADVFGENTPANKVTAIAKTMGVRGLRYSRRGEGRAWVWTGSECQAATKPMLELG